MRLLTLSNCPLLPNQGSGYVTLGFAEGLRRRGWTVDLLGPEQIDPCPQLGRARSWRMAFGMFNCARRYARRSAYDVIEFYGGEAWLAISKLAKWPHRKFLIVSHSNGLEPYCREQLRLGLGADTHNGRKRRWYQLRDDALTARGFRRADALVTVSDIELGYARARGYQPESRMLAIDNPLPDEFLSLPVTFDRDETIGYCGSWIPRKGVSLLAQDIGRILRDFPRTRLRLIGVGADFQVRDHFADDVQRRVEVLPFVADKRALLAAYSDCAIVVAPSIYESFGMTTAEAMACGCAVVAGRTGFAAGLRDGVEVVLLPTTSSPSLYEAVRGLLLDPARRAQIAANAHRHVQSLRWSDAVDRLAAAYQRWSFQ